MNPLAKYVLWVLFFAFLVYVTGYALDGWYVTQYANVR